MHWPYKHDEIYVFENFSWKRQSIPIQHDSGYVIIQPHPGLLQMIKHHNHGLIFRTSGKDWRNLHHHLTTISSLTMAKPSSPQWAPTTVVRASTLRPVTTSFSFSHTSTTSRTSKQTTDHLPSSTLFISTMKKKKTEEGPPLPTSTLTTSTPKLSTTTTTIKHPSD